jgi:hypothetical protein
MTAFTIAFVAATLALVSTMVLAMMALKRRSLLQCYCFNEEPYTLLAQRWALDAALCNDRPRFGDRGFVTLASASWFSLNS